MNMNVDIDVECNMNEYEYCCWYWYEYQAWYEWGDDDKRADSEVNECQYELQF